MSAKINIRLTPQQIEVVLDVLDDWKYQEAPFADRSDPFLVSLSEIISEIKFATWANQED